MARRLWSGLALALVCVVAAREHALPDGEDVLISHSPARGVFTCDLPADRESFGFAMFAVSVPRTADLLVGTTEHVSKHTAQWKWRVARKDNVVAEKVVFVSRSDPEWPEDGVFHIKLDYKGHGAVVKASCLSKAATELKVSDRDEAPLYTSLSNGVPFNDTIGGSYAAFRIFSFPVSGASIGNVQISVTPTYGDPDLYVNNDGTVPSSSSYRWRSNHFGADSITIPSSDPHACPSSCTYLICVVAWGTHTTEYSIVATASGNGAATELLDGVPVREELQQGTHANYYIASNTIGTLTISTTALSGDPDIYVSTMGNPSPTNYEWASTRYGSDTLSISPTLLGGNYYIAIYSAGTQATTYDLVASIEQPIVLSNNVPESGITGSSKVYTLSSWNPSTGSVYNVSFHIVVTSGSAQAFLGRGYVPNATTNIGSTIPWIYDQSIATTQTATTCSYYCEYYLKVVDVGFGNASYTITASIRSGQNDHEVLTEGLPTPGSVVRQGWKYYSFINSHTDSALIFTVTALSGDPDVYINSPGHSALPSIASHDFAGTASGNDTVTVPPASVQVGTYYIGIYGFSGATYTIVATTANMVTLVDGVGQRGSVLAQSIAYYTFNVNEAASSGQIQLSLTTAYPDSAWLLVSVGTLPTPTNYVWRNHSRLSLNYMGTAQYRIGVYSFVNATFTVTASTSAAIVTLSSGVPVTNTLAAAGSFAYYRIYVGFFSTASVLGITVTPDSVQSDPDLYISVTNPEPTTSNFTWRGTRFGADAVEISGGDAHASSYAYYYIGVRAFSANCGYTIVAALSTTTFIALSNNYPQAGYVTGGTSQFYSFYVGPRALAVRASISVSAGLVNLTASPTSTFSPTTWTALQVNSGVKLDIPTASPGCWDCTLYFKVASLGTTTAQYQITVFTPGTSLRRATGQHAAGKRKRLA